MYNIVCIYGSFLSHGGYPKIIHMFRIFHEINHPASLGDPHDYGNLHVNLVHEIYLHSMAISGTYIGGAYHIQGINFRPM